MTDRRNLIGDALAALDQSLTVAGEQTAFDRDYWLQRAAVNAATAQAQQSRVANLIAWKQLRQTQSATALSGAGDAITAEIEATLGITDPETGPIVDGLTPIDLSSADYRAGEADGYERGWLARDRDLRPEADL